MSEQTKHYFWMPFIAVLLLLAAIGAVFVGVVHIPAKSVMVCFLQKFGLFSGVTMPEFYTLTLWQLRIPRIVMSLLSGASLAICGGVFQSIFRNPICDPYILGISSGASLGAAIAIIIGWDTFLFGITALALVTALITLLFIVGVARIKGGHATQTLLLTGIALNFLMSAVITLLIVVNQQEMHKIYFWTMGSLSSVSWPEIAILFPMMLMAVVVLFYYAKDLNIMQMGGESAQTLGVNTHRTTIVTLVTSSVLVAVIVSFCGVIGFIGLIVPHIARLLFGSNNRHLFAYSLLFGAFFLLIADTLARTIAAPAELPVGSITALAGAPYFIYLVLRKGL